MDRHCILVDGCDNIIGARSETELVRKRREFDLLVCGQLLQLRFVLERVTSSKHRRGSDKLPSKFNRMLVAPVRRCGVVIHLTVVEEIRTASTLDILWRGFEGMRVIIDICPTHLVRVNIGSCGLA